MKISIIPDEHGYSEKFCLFLQVRGHQTKILDVNSQDLLEQIAETDGFMWRASLNIEDKQIAHRLLLVVEKYLNIPVYPDFNTFWHHDDKVAQHYLFQALKIPTPKTWVFWNKEQAIEWAKTSKYPLVHKYSTGASSANVSIVNSFSEAKKIITDNFAGRYSRKIQPVKKIDRTSLYNLKYKIFTLQDYLFRDEYPIPTKSWEIEKNYAYFQEFLPNNSFNTRIAIIGDRGFARQQLNSENDFRARGSNNIFDMNSIDIEFLSLAFKISSENKFQAMNYDFLYDDGKPVLCEMSHSCSEEKFYKFPGYWDHNMNWHEGHIWPQEAIVEDFIVRVKKHKESH